MNDETSELWDWIMNDPAEWPYILSEHIKARALRTGEARKTTATRLRMNFETYALDCGLPLYKIQWTKIAEELMA